MKHKKYNKNHMGAQHKGDNRNGGRGIHPTVTINIKNLHIHMDERMTTTSLILPDEPEGCSECGACGKRGMCGYESEEE